MKECNILGDQVKTYSDPSYIFFRGSGLPNPMIYAPDKSNVNCVAVGKKCPCNMQLRRMKVLAINDKSVIHVAG